MLHRLRTHCLFGLALAVFWLAAPSVRADESRPIELSVDLTQAPRRLYQARLVIPAKPGPLTLWYPKWIQGEHQPSGPISDLSSVKMRAAGKPISWRRDDVDMYAFHCTIPDGADPTKVEPAPAGRPGFKSR